MASPFSGIFGQAGPGPNAGEPKENTEASSFSPGKPSTRRSQAKSSAASSVGNVSFRSSAGQQVVSDLQATPTATRGEQQRPGEVIRDISREVLMKYMPDWDKKGHKHISFRGKEFMLESLDGLVRLSGKHTEANKIDLTHLESFDVSENRLRDLSCLRGTQGFTALRVLKARRNCLIYFEVNLPTLRELDLSHNNLKEIPPTSGMPELEVCVLAHNDMNSTFEPFRNCKMLKKIDLSCNRFSCRPTELRERLVVLETLPFLHALKLKDNPFCRLLPEYQTFVLQHLPGLTKFDDMENIKEAKELSMTFDGKNLNEYDQLVFDRGKADRLALGVRDEGHAKETHMPNFQELMDPIQEALGDSSKDTMVKCVKELIRICDKIHGARPEELHKVFRELKAEHTGKGASETEFIDSVMNQFLGDFVLLHSRIDEDKEQRVMLLRCLAKLAIVHCQEFGEKCMSRLGWLMKRSPEAEIEVLKVIEEIVVEPLRFKTLLDKQTMPAIKGLARFDSPKLPEALAPIAGWLARSYCIMGASPQQDVTRLLAVATRNQLNTERAIAFHNTDGYLSGKQDTLAAHVILALENKTLSQNESLREQFMGHLQIVTNTAKYGGQRVVEVYEDKQLHRELVKMCTTFFGGCPIDTTKPYTKVNANSVRKPVDISHLKVLDIRTCAALLDAIASLMEQSHDILLDLADAKPPNGVPVVEFYSIAPRAPISDPVLLGSSLKGLHLILDQYSHENAAARNEMITLIINDLDKMSQMLEYINGDKTQYQRLWQKAEFHLAQKAEGGTGKSGLSSAQAPKLTALTNPLVHEAFEAIITVVKYFTAEADKSKLCARVSKAMDEGSRERLLFQLLQVPSTTVRSAVMSTLAEVDSAEMSSDEVGYLVDLLNQAKDLSREESLLRQVIMQLQKFAAEREGAGAGAALRADHSNTSIDAVMNILMRNSMRKTFSASEEGEKTELSQACVLFLKTVSKWPDLRETNLRSKNINGSLIDVLKFEDELHSPFNPDIGAESTWTGRNVETLLQCISGRERLKARGKVAYRVMCRIADVLEGRSDKPRSQDVEERSSMEMAKDECEMFDEGRMKRELKHLDDVERSDRALQQQVFAAFNGLDRLAGFLSDLYANAEKKQVGRRLEQANQDKSMDFVNKAKTDAKQMSDSADLALTHGDEALAAVGDAASPSDGDTNWDEMENAQTNQIDRRLVMQVMNRFDLQKPQPVKPDLQIGFSLGSSLPRELQIQEEFADGEGRVNVAMPVAAMLRACFALLKVPAAEHIRGSMKTCLKDYLMVGHILSLVQMCGPLDCCVAAKFLRLMSVALKLPASQPKEEADRVIIFDMLASYYGTLCGSMVRAVRQQDNAELAARGRMTATEIARLASVIITTVPFCRLTLSGNALPQDHLVQDAFFEQCYLRLMPMDVAKSILQMALDSSSGQGKDAPPGTDKDMDQVNQMWGLLRVMISALLVKCPKMKYDIFMMFSHHIVAGSVSLPQSFLSGVLAQMKQAEDKSKLEQAMGDTMALPAPEPECSISPAIEGPEKTIAYARCEVLYPDEGNGKWLEVADPSSNTPFLACVITNKGLMIIDASQGGYPQNPSVIKHRDLRDVTRLVRGGSSQVIYVGLMKKAATGYGEEFMVLICHRESDRAEVLGALHALSVPAGGGHLSKVPLQTDQAFKKALDNIVVDQPLLSVFVKREVEPNVEELRFVVLSENQFYEIVTSFEFWLPADREQAEEAGSDSDREELGGEDDMAKQQPEGAAGGANKHKKNEDDDMMGDVFGGAGGDGGQKAQQLKLTIKEVTSTKEKARQKEKTFKKDANGQIISSLEKSVEALMRAEPIRQVNTLEKVSFFPEGTPKMTLKFEGGDEVTMVFFDDTVREHWKRTIVSQLSRADQAPGSKWVSNFHGKR